MRDTDYRWIEFGSILIATGACVICMYVTVLEWRWQRRRQEMNVTLESLRRDPQMLMCIDSEQIMIDTKVGELRRVVF